MTGNPVVIFSNSGLGQSRRLKKLNFRVPDNTLPFQPAILKGDSIGIHRAAPSRSYISVGTRRRRSSKKLSRKVRCMGSFPASSSVTIVAGSCRPGPNRSRNYPEERTCEHRFTAGVSPPRTSRLCWVTTEDLSRSPLIRYYSFTRKCLAHADLGLVGSAPSLEPVDRNAEASQMGAETP